MLFNPLYQEIDFSPTNYTSEDLYTYFEKPFRILSAPPLNELRNLIFLNIESFEDQALGRYFRGSNKNCIGSMPFLTNLTDYSIFPLNAFQAKHLTYTMAGLFAAHCNLPIIGGQINARLETTTYQRCFNTVLSKLGYILEAYASNPGTINWQNVFFSNSGYTKFLTTRNYFSKESDELLFDYVEKNVLPKLVPGASKKPYLITIETTNTHLGCYPKEPMCKVRLPQTCPEIIQSFDCEDQIIEKFMKVFYQYNLQKNTDIIIFGDHLHFSDDYFSSANGRRIGIIIPSILNRTRIAKVSRTSNLYDIAPTALHMLNITIDPPYLYGASLLDDSKEPIYPSFYDDIILSNIYQQTFQLSKKLTNESGSYHKLKHINSTTKYAYLNLVNRH